MVFQSLFQKIASTLHERLDSRTRDFWHSGTGLLSWNVPCCGEQHPGGEMMAFETLATQTSSAVVNEPQFVRSRWVRAAG